MITRRDNGSLNCFGYLCAACARLSIKYANYANYAALLDLFVALFDRQVVATLPLRIRNSVWAWHSAIAQVLSNSHSTRMSMIYTLSTHLAPSHDTRFMRQWIMFAQTIVGKPKVTQYFFV